MVRPLIILNVVGLTPRLISRGMPVLQALCERGAMRSLRTIVPAVTCSVQATLLTGMSPRDHGIVGNGWYFRELSEVWLWRQSNHLVQRRPVWEDARRLDSSVTCANLFWWYNMYSSADIGVTPRPIYKADGRKIPDIYTNPADLRFELTAKLGSFPLFKFWGPGSDIASSRWIGRCAQYILMTRRPTLTFVYLPHLDYGLQKWGPSSALLDKDLREIDDVCGEILDVAKKQNAQVIVHSEYAIRDVRQPVHINRELRRAGFLRVRNELGLELLDAGASDAFAVADHQVAHVYVKDGDRAKAVQRLLAALPGVDAVLDYEGKRAYGLNHERAGEYVVLAKPDAWFTYYYWLDDARAPDFARTVDIHRKPGYDPVELFVDPRFRWPKLSIGMRLARKTLGFRTLMDVIPLDADLVRGSHGTVGTDLNDEPVVISSEPDLVAEGPVEAAQFRSLVLEHLFPSLRKAEVYRAGAQCHPAPVVLQ